jgi:hypothetical protein
MADMTTVDDRQILVATLSGCCVALRNVLPMVGQVTDKEAQSARTTLHHAARVLELGEAILAKEPSR